MVCSTHTQLLELHLVGFHHITINFFNYSNFTYYIITIFNCIIIYLSFIHKYIIFRLYMLHIFVIILLFHSLHITFHIFMLYMLHIFILVVHNFVHILHNFNNSIHISIYILSTCCIFLTNWSFHSINLSRFSTIVYI